MKGQTFVPDTVKMFAFVQFQPHPPVFSGVVYGLALTKSTPFWMFFFKSVIVLAMLG